MLPLPPKISHWMKCHCCLQEEFGGFFPHTVTCETSIWLPDMRRRKSRHPQTIRSPARSLVTYLVWAAEPLYPHHYTTSCQIKTFKLCECLLGTFPFSQQHIAEIIEDISSQTVTKRWKAKRERWQLVACGGNEGLSKVSPCLSRII